MLADRSGAERGFAHVKAAGHTLRPPETPNREVDRAGLRTIRRQAWAAAQL